jgi:hypothetical protein
MAVIGNKILKVFKQYNIVSQDALKALVGKSGEYMHRYSRQGFFNEPTKGVTLLYDYYAWVAERVDARDLKSLGRKAVPVRVRPQAPVI